jgi:hypothetical protein
MARSKTVKRLTELLGAEVIGDVPEAGGGAFGAARLPRLIATLRDTLSPGQGRRPGRPTNPKWRRHPKVPMSDQTLRELQRLAERASAPGR